MGIMQWFPKGLDSARYKACGNTVSPQIAEWIGRRILEAEKVRTE
jgi:site-specific DNA-cytosine methylase